MISDTKLLRWGAVAGMLSAAIAVVFNAIHPRASSKSLDDIDELLRIVSGSGSWRLVHLASVFATLIGVVAIVALLWSMMLEGSSRWPAIAFVSLVITTPTLLLSVGLDGFAIKSVADRWAATAVVERPGLVAAVASQIWCKSDRRRFQ